MSPTCAQVLPFHRYSIAQGLVSNGINAMVQDSGGYLWIGTGEGVSIFDGFTFRNLTIADGLPMNSITCLSPGRTPGTIVAGTWGGGIVRWVGDRLKILAPDSLPGALNILDVEEDCDGNLWCATQSGTFVLTGDGSVPLTGTGNVQTLLIDDDGLAWCVSPGAIHLFSTHDRSEVGRVEVPGSSGVSAIHRDRHGAVWITTKDNLLVKMLHRKRVDVRKLPCAIVRSIADDVGGNLWFATDDGLVFGDYTEPSAPRYIRYTTDHGLSENRLTGCLIDFENNLWAWGDHLVRLSGRNPRTFALDGVPASYNNSKAVTDAFGHIWAVTTSGIVEVWEDSGSTWHSTLHHMAIEAQGGSTPTIVLDARKSIWVDTGRDVEVYAVHPAQHGASSLARLLSMRRGRDLPPVDRFFIVPDSHGNLWISTFGKGVYKVSASAVGGRFVHLTSGDGLPHDDIRAISEDLSGNIWLGGVEGGIAVIDPAADTVVRRYTHANGLPDEYIRGICADSKGRMWVATRRNGLAVIGNDGVKQISVSDGLAGSAVWAIAGDAATDRMWIGSQFGVQEVDASTLTPLRPKESLTTGPVASLGALPGRFLWYISGDLLSVYDYGTTAGQDVPPPVYITKVVAGGRLKRIDSVPRLSHDENTCTFEYVGIGYRESGGITFRYRLRGIDEEWQPATAMRTVTYAQLPPGSYTFEVSATNADGIASAEPARFSFSLSPPFWQTWWFIGLTLSAAVSVLALFIRGRVQRVLELERLRMRIARDLHDEIGSNLSSIAMASGLLGNHSGADATVRERLAWISTIAVATVADMKDIVWLLNPANDSLDDLFQRMKDAASGILEGCRYSVTFPHDPGSRTVRLEWKRNTYLIFKECLANIIKHARATAVEIVVHVVKDHFILSVSDNGTGFDPGQIRRGDGIRNMRDRATMMGGTIAIRSAPGQGTIVELESRIT